ncbi:hypothetical protein BD410DRAFT_704447, partial [Rickenella mellea]
LTTENRPAEVKAFIKNGRDYKRDVGISKLVEYAESCRMWWRIEGSDPWPLTRARTPENETWGKIKRAGTNGFLIVVLTLVWW